MLYEEGQEGLTWEQKEEHIKELWQEVKRLDRHAQLQGGFAEQKARRIAQVDFYLQDSDTWDEDTETVLTRIAELLDIDLDTTKTFEVMVKFEVEVVGKRNADWSSVDAYSLGVSEDISISLGDFDIGNVEADIESVEEQ